MKMTIEKLKLKKYRRAVIVVTTIGVLVFTSIMLFALCRQHAQKNQCLAHLRMIDGSINSCAVMDGVGDGYMLPLEEVCLFIKGGQWPQCPSGAQYVLPLTGCYPNCPYHGDLIQIFPDGHIPFTGQQIFFLGVFAFIIAGCVAGLIAQWILRGSCSIHNLFFNKVLRCANDA